MIQKIPYQSIDFIKYQNCVENSLNYKIYAEKWYLDALTNTQWFCYVYKDYEAVMPVCFKKKWGLKYIVQPTFCQQLGVFYTTPLSDVIFAKFYKKLKKNIVKNYAFNDDNTAEFCIKGTKKNNYILDLNKPYEELHQNFNQNTKRNLKKYVKLKNDFTLSESSLNPIGIENYIVFKKINAEHIKTPILKNLRKLLETKKILQNSVIICLSKNEIDVSKMIFTQYKSNIYYLNGVSSLAKKKEANSVALLNKLIKNNANKYTTLDLEGSDNKGVAQFFKGFGAKNKPYKIFSNI